MLRTDVVRPGDVLLSHGGGAFSKAIATATEGPFSHAAFVINAALTFESDKGVIGHRLLRPLGFGKAGDEVVRLAEVPGEPSYFAIFRHPRIAEISSEQFAKVVEEVMSDNYGLDYSQLQRLVPLGTFAAGLDVLVAHFARLLDHFKQDAIHGPFCSELVTRFYERLGLPLFTGNHRPSEVSPNDLSRSALNVVPEAVIASKDVRDFRPALFSRVGWGIVTPNEDALAVNMHNTRRDKRALDALEAAVNDLTHHWSVASCKALRRSLEQESVRLANHLCATQALGKKPAIRRATRLCVRFFDLVPAMQNPPEVFSHPEKYFGLINDWSAYQRSCLRTSALLIADINKEGREQCRGWPHVIHRLRLHCWRRKYLRLARKGIRHSLEHEQETLKRLATLKSAGRE